MKGRNKEKILKLFDYFKIAFELNMTHKELYKPQIIFLVLRAVLIFLAGISMVEITNTMMPFIGSVTVTKFFALTWSEFRGTPLLLFLTTFLVSGFGSTYVEAGLYDLYGKINRDQTEDLSFSSSANRYFLTFLIGNILIVLFWIVASLPYLIVGLLTMTLGLVWVPIIVSALLMVWKAAVVTEETGVFDAFGKSIAFCRRNFWPTTIIILIKSAVSTMTGSGGSTGNSGNVSNSFNNFDNGSIESMPFDGPSFSPSFGKSKSFDVLPTLLTGVIALVSVVSVLAGMVQMLFEIFFGITAVVIYQDDWSLPETESAPLDLDMINDDVMEVE